jgi:hypothetical protein
MSGEEGGDLGGSLHAETGVHKLHSEYLRDSRVEILIRPPSWDRTTFSREIFTTFWQTGLVLPRNEYARQS